MKDNFRRIAPTVTPNYDPAADSSPASPAPAAADAEPRCVRRPPRRQLAPRAGRRAVAKLWSSAPTPSASRARLSDRNRRAQLYRRCRTATRAPTASSRGRKHHRAGRRCDPPTERGGSSADMRRDLWIFMPDVCRQPSCACRSRSLTGRVANGDLARPTCRRLQSDLSPAAKTIDGQPAVVVLDLGGRPRRHLCARALLGGRKDQRPLKDRVLARTGRAQDRTLRGIPPDGRRSVPPGWSWRTRSEGRRSRC